MSFVILKVEILELRSLQSYSADKNSMADNNQNHFLEHQLKKIKATVQAEVPSYLASTTVTQTQHRYEDDKPTYRVLDCSVKLADRSEIGFQAASVMYEAVVSLEKNEEGSLQYVMVKTMPDSAMIRQAQNSEDQFFNESKMYTEIIPLLLQTCAVSNRADLKAEKPSWNLSAACDLFPKCYFASSDPGSEMIVLENLRTLGYRIGGDRYMLLDYDHISIVLEGLARFHALSYGTKKKNPITYEERVVTQIRDGRRFVKRETVSNLLNEGYQKFLGRNALLVFDKFNEKQLEEGGSFTEDLVRVRRRAEDCVELIRELLTPEEPLSVLCHGDFNRNNMMFRYDSDNKPCDVKFIDFQTPFYASPAVDLSFFLFVNASPELWASRWNEMFSQYHRTLLDALSEFLNCSQEELQPEFSREAFEAQFSKYMLYGFLIATSFIATNVENPCSMKFFDLLAEGTQTWEEIFSNTEDSVNLDRVEVIDRVLPLTKELMDRIRV